MLSLCSVIFYTFGSFKNLVVSKSCFPWECVHSNGMFIEKIICSRGDLSSKSLIEIGLQVVIAFGHTAHQSIWRKKWRYASDRFSFHCEAILLN